MVKVGDTVKCLDFAGNESHYFIGEVFYVGSDFFNAKTVRVVRENVEVSLEKVQAEFSSPMQGVHFMDEKFPGRVTVIA